jgi:hypothetical protein
MAKDVRQNLRDTAEDVDLAAFFREAAKSESSCRQCKAPIPDWNARTSALRLLLEQGYGKAPAQDDKPAIDLADDPSTWTPEQRAAAATELRRRLGIGPARGGA